MIQVPIKKQNFGIYYNGHEEVESLIFHDKEDIEKLISTLNNAVTELKIKKQKDFDSKRQLTLGF